MRCVLQSSGPRMLDVCSVVDPQSVDSAQYTEYSALILVKMILGP